jgi:hypothetical protein
MRAHIYMASGRMILMALAISSLLRTTPVWSQNRQAEIQRDVNILETVLCQVLGQGESSRFWGGSCRGMYLEGFGIIFNVPYGSHFHGLAVAPKAWSAKSSGSAAGSRNLAETVYAAVEDSRSDSSRAEQQEQQRRQVKKDLVHFFTSYAGAVRGLAQGEVVAVMIDWADESAFFGPSPASADDRHFYASVSQEKLAQLRQMQNPETAIQFRDKTGTADLDRELDIFENILDKAMAGPENGDVPMPRKSIRSMYLPGYGVVMMMNLQHFGGLAIPAIAKVTGVFKVPEAAKSKTDNQAKRLAALKESLLDVLTRFGGSLRSLKADESMFIQVDLSNDFEEAGQSFSCKVRMADIEQVYAGKVTAAAFKNAVQMRDF